MHTIVRDAIVVELEQNAQIVENETERVTTKKDLKQEKDRPHIVC